MHFPCSPGLQNDDRVLEDPTCFDGKYVVMTEKMDGENTTLYRNAIHARSMMDMAPHPSRTWVQALHGRIKHDIPEGFRICGENLYAKHSIKYDKLPSYFLVFSIWNGDICLNWEETEEWCKLLDLLTVPFWLEGNYSEDMHSFGQRFMQVPQYGEACEGYVVRNHESFQLDDFQTNVAKYVRKGHVQTSEHWLNEPMVKNELLNAATV